MRTRFYATTLACLMVLVGVAVVATPVSATFPGSNGRLLYQGPGSGYATLDLWTVKANGNDAMRLTYSSAGWSEPQWSPDGSKIAFGRGNDIWVMNADGTGETNITSGGEPGWTPAWTPDGLHITYVGMNLQAWTIDAGGGNNSQLTNLVNPQVGGELSWSPDGTALAFVNPYNNGTDIWVAPAANLNAPVQITNDTAIETSLSWAPDSSRLAFEREASTDHQRDIYSIEPNGWNVHRLTTNVAVDGHPTWSPDGKKIAFFSERVLDGAIYVMNADGSNETRMTFYDWVAGPLWQPCLSACASVIEKDPPSSIITQPVDGVSYTADQLGTFAGTATDALSGVRRVNLSLRKAQADGSCRWWTGSRFEIGGCGKAQWFKASGQDSWTYALPIKLKPTADTAASYRLRARAVDRVGNVEGAFTAGANQSTFEIE